MGEAIITVIAWDGKMLAADRQASFGGTRMMCRKVRAVTSNGKRVLVGGSGARSDLEAFIAWLRSGGEKPRMNQSDNFVAMVVDDKRRVWQYEAEQLIPLSVRAPFHAIGSGRGEAMGAMAMGADARKAVLIAQRFDVGCGGGVDVIEW